MASFLALLQIYSQDTVMSVEVTTDMDLMHFTEGAVWGWSFTNGVR